jgi:hypothetical protein
MLRRDWTDVDTFVQNEQTRRDKRAARLLEVHHMDGGGDVLLVPDSELRTVCRRHGPRGG